MNIILILGAVIGVFYVLTQNGDDDTSSDGTTLAGDNSGDGGTLSNSPFGSLSAFTAAWAQAIAPAENVNPAYNNPGGLNMQGDLGSTPAAEGGGNVIGIFSSLSAGYAALQGILNSYVTRFPNLTLLQATSRYVTGSPGSGDPSSYPANVVNEANTVASNLGVSVNSTLGSLAGS